MFTKMWKLHETRFMHDSKLCIIASYFKASRHKRFLRRDKYVNRDQKKKYGTMCYLKKLDIYTITAAEIDRSLLMRLNFSRYQFVANWSVGRAGGVRSKIADDENKLDLC